jgi:hypothetical protein
MAKFNPEFCLQNVSVFRISLSKKQIFPKYLFIVVMETLYAWERREKCTRFWWESPREGDHLEDQGVGG